MRSRDAWSGGNRRTASRREPGVHGILVRVCAAMCMFLAILFTAGVGTLIASLYGQGRLSLPENLSPIQPVVSVGGASSGGADVLATEVQELRQQLAQMRADNAARGPLHRANATEDEDYTPPVTIGSLRRELDSALRDVEDAKRRLAGEERVKRELEERVQRLVLEQQRREGEERDRARKKEEELRERIKDEVERAKSETEVKMANRELARDLEAAQGIVAQSREQVEQAQEQLRAERAAREELRLAKVTAEGELATLQSALREARQQAQNVAKRAATLDTKVELAEASASAALSAAATAAAAEKAANERAVAAAAEAAHHVKESARLDAELKAEQQRNEDKAQALAAAQAAQAAAEREASSLRGAVQDLAEAVAQANQTQGEALVAHSELQSEFQSVRSKQQACEAQVTDAESKTRELLAAVQEEKRAAAEAAEQAAAQLQRVTQQLEAANRTIEQLKPGIADAKGAGASGSQQLGQLHRAEANADSVGDEDGLCSAQPSHDGGGSCGLAPPGSGEIIQTSGPDAREPEIPSTLSAVMSLTKDTFESHANLPGTALFVKFFAPWCQHCKRMAPDWEAIAAQLQQSPAVLIAEVDCKAHKELCQAEAVEGLPTIRMYRKGTYTEHAGKRDKDSLLAFIEQGSAGLPGTPASSHAGESTADRSGLTSPSGAGRGADAGTGAGGGEAADSKGRLSDDALAAVYAKLRGGGTRLDAPLNSQESAPSAGKSGDGSGDSGGAGDEQSLGKLKPPAETEPQESAGAASGGAISDDEKAARAAEAAKRWEDALGQDPKAASRLQDRARRAAPRKLAEDGKTVEGREEGKAAENKFCQEIAGEHSIFDSVEGGCRCKTGFEEDEAGQCVEGGQNQGSGESGASRSDGGAGDEQSLGKLKLGTGADADASVPSKPLESPAEEAIFEASGSRGEAPKQETLPDDALAAAYAKIRGDAKPVREDAGGRPPAGGGSVEERGAGSQDAAAAAPVDEEEEEGVLGKLLDENEDEDEESEVLGRLED